MSAVRLLCLFALLFSCQIVSSVHLSDNSGKIGIQINSNGSYSILVSGEVWFNSGPTVFHANNQTLSTEDGSLKIQSDTSYTGSDPIGAFNATQLTFVGTTGNHLIVTFRVYQSTPAISFEAFFPESISGCSTGQAQGITTSFPGFQFEGESGNKGYVTYQMWSQAHVGNWDNQSNPPGGGAAGVPVAIWDHNMQNTVVISPLSSFMAVSQAKWTTKGNLPIMGFGLVGTMKNIPGNYSYKTIIYAGTSLNKALNDWGQLLRRYYGKDISFMESDFTINYLGYWTDNGACYYYFPGESGSYETTLINVSSTSTKAKIPYRYLQLDSWWYYKGQGNGVKNWTTMTTADIFPRGIQYVQNATGWPIVGHNRYWSTNTDYAKQNGGKYQFIIETTAAGNSNDIALPNDSSFWDFLISSSHNEWELVVYEQDWLSTVWDELDAIKQDVNVGRNWLLDMGASATRYGLTVQYCMAYPRHFLQSVEIPAVTQIRVSTDYHQSNSQWQIGDSSAIAHALGLAPFKDDFRTSTVAQPCGDSDVEKYPALETTVAILSGGPVGPSDHIDDWDAALTLRTCRTDGLLLKPSIPALSIDSTYMYRAFGSGGPNGQVWDAISIIDNFVFHHILVVQLVSSYALSVSQLNDFGQGPLSPSIIFLDGAPSQIGLFDATYSVTLKQCSEADFQLYHSAPLFSNGWALLGETSKIVPVSPQRIKNIEDNGPQGISIGVVGVPSEVVVLTLAQNDNGSFKTVSFTCNLPMSGTATLQVPSGTCA